MDDLDRKKRWDPVINEKIFGLVCGCRGKKLFNYIKKFNPHILSAYVEHANDSWVVKPPKWAMKNTGIRGKLL